MKLASFKTVHTAQACASSRSVILNQCAIVAMQFFNKPDTAKVQLKFTAKSVTMSKKIRND